MAFYKNDNGEVLVGENYVYSPIVALTKETKDDFEYPQDDWYWFDTREEAYSFFGVEITVEPVKPVQPKRNYRL